MSMTMTMTGSARKVAEAGILGRRGGLWLVCATLLLAGCPSAGAPQLSGLAEAGLARLAPPAGGIPVAERAGRTARAPLSGPSGRAQDGGLGRSDTAAGAPPADSRQVAAVPPDRMEPDALVGLDPKQTERLLGQPSGTEDESPARVWRYAGAGCTLRVFFFKDMISEDFRALSYDMTSSHNVPYDDQRCFALLVAQAWDGGRD